MSNWCQAQLTWSTHCREKTRAPGFFLQKYFWASHIWSGRCKVCSRFMTANVAMQSQSIARQICKLDQSVCTGTPRAKICPCKRRAAAKKIQKYTNTATCVCVCVFVCVCVQEEPRQKCAGRGFWKQSRIAQVAEQM